MSKKKLQAAMQRQRIWILTAALLCLVVIIFWLIWAQPWRVFFPNDGYRYVIGVSQQNVVTSREIALKQELRQAVEGDDDVNLILANAHGSIENQQQQIESLMRQRVDAIIVDSASAAALRDTLASVQGAGIPLILVGDESLSGMPCDLLLVNDYAHIGRLAGEYFSREVQGADSILEVQGIPRSTEAQTLQAGLRLGMAEEGRIACTIAGYHSRAIAGQRIRDSLVSTAPFDIHAVFAHDTELASGVLDSLGDLPVVCVQYGEPMQALPFHAVVQADPGGAHALEAAMALLAQKPTDSAVVLLPAELKLLKEVAP